jgi:hypothetical protein
MFTVGRSFHNLSLGEITSKRQKKNNMESAGVLSVIGTADAEHLPKPSAQ